MSPWTFAAVCVMVPALTLLVFGLSQVPVVELLPGYVAAYLLIGGGNMSLSVDPNGGCGPLSWRSFSVSALIEAAVARGGGVEFPGELEPEMLDDQDDAAATARGILDVVASVRSAKPLMP
jgi:hypothetical protein